MTHSSFRRTCLAVAWAEAGVVLVEVYVVP